MNLFIDSQGRCFTVLEQFNNCHNFELESIVLHDGQVGWYNPRARYMHLSSKISTEQNIIDWIEMVKSEKWRSQSNKEKILLNLHFALDLVRKHQRNLKIEKIFEKPNSDWDYLTLAC
jgi:hypothetical protein